MDKESYDALSDKTKKELHINPIDIIIVDDKDIDYNTKHDRYNIVQYFKMVWNIIETSNKNAKAASELFKLKSSIATIKGALE